MHLAVNPDTYVMVTEKCVSEFLKHHPEFKGVKISHEFIIKRIAKYYIESW